MPVAMIGCGYVGLVSGVCFAEFGHQVTCVKEISELCEQVGADVQQVARGIGLDNRIGAKFLHAGPGFGGSKTSNTTVCDANRYVIENAPLRCPMLTAEGASA